MQGNANLMLNRTTRMMEWLANHPRIQHRICCEDFGVEPEECIQIIEMLEEKEFYELVYILLLKNEQQIVIADVLEKLKTGAWAREWEKVGNEKMCRDIKEKIRNEMTLREMKNDNIF